MNNKIYYILNQKKNQQEKPNYSQIYKTQQNLYLKLSFKNPTKKFILQNQCTLKTNLLV